MTQEQQSALDRVESILHYFDALHPDGDSGESCAFLKVDELRALRELIGGRE